VQIGSVAQTALAQLSTARDFLPIHDQRQSRIHLSPKPTGCDHRKVVAGEENQLIHCKREWCCHDQSAVFSGRRDSWEYNKKFRRACHPQTIAISDIKVDSYGYFCHSLPRR
jgi:hypothetical protein